MQELNPSQVKKDTLNWLNRLEKLHKELQRLYLEIKEVYENV